MPPILPTTEPLQLTSGDTVSWQVSLNDYPASAGWGLTYYLLSATATITIPTTAAGDDHLVSVPPATTAAWIPGVYTWASYATLATDRHTVATGQIEIVPNLATATSPPRSSYRIQLAAVQSVLEGTATYSQRVVEINGKRLDRHSLAELIHAQNVLAHKVAQEDDAARVASGLPSRSRVLVRFS